jgi:hypothetical protein
MRDTGASELVELQGYVGPSEDGTVRWFPTRSTKVGIEIPEDAIVHFVDPSRAGEASKLFVDSNAQLRLVVAATEVFRARDIGSSFSGKKGGCGCGGEGSVARATARAITTNTPGGGDPGLSPCQACQLIDEICDAGGGGVECRLWAFICRVINRCSPDIPGGPTPPISFV